MATTTRKRPTAEEKRRKERDKEYDSTRDTSLLRVRGSTAEVVRAMAAVEKRNMIDQLDIIVDAGVTALGYKPPRAAKRPAKRKAR